LHVDHTAWQTAARLVAALGGRPSLPAAGTVYQFLTTAARNQALGLVRSKTGWSVASAFDGRHWLPKNPVAGESLVSTGLLILGPS
jgi:hypothetical protein